MTFTFVLRGKLGTKWLNKALVLLPGEFLTCFSQFNDLFNDSKKYPVTFVNIKHNNQPRCTVSFCSFILFFSNCLRKLKTIMILPEIKLKFSQRLRVRSNKTCFTVPQLFQLFRRSLRQPPTFKPKMTQVTCRLLTLMPRMPIMTQITRRPLTLMLIMTKVTRRPSRILITLLGSVLVDCLLKRTRSHQSSICRDANLCPYFVLRFNQLSRCGDIEENPGPDDHDRQELSPAVNAQGDGLKPHGRATLQVSSYNVRGLETPKKSDIWSIGV